MFIQMGGEDVACLAKGRIPMDFLVGVNAVYVAMDKVGRVNVGAKSCTQILHDVHGHDLEVCNLVS